MNFELNVHLDAKRRDYVLSCRRSELFSCPLFFRAWHPQLPFLSGEVHKVMLFISVPALVRLTYIGPEIQGFQVVISRFHYLHISVVLVTGSCRRNTN